MVETVLDQGVQIPVLRVDDVDVVEDGRVIFDQLIVLLVQQNQHPNVLFHISEWKNKRCLSPIEINRFSSVFSPNEQILLRG